MAIRAHASSADFVVAVMAATAVITPIAIVQGNRTATSAVFLARLTTEGSRIGSDPFHGS